MDGLYAFKPWYAARLTRMRGALVAHDVSPTLITWAGVGFAGAAGLTLGLVQPGPFAGLLVGTLLMARLACANLDGGVAREGGRTTRWGSIVNELGDRIADLAVLAGCLVLAPVSLVAATGFAIVLPSWVSLAGTSVGLTRIQGGPCGKTERCVLFVLLATTGLATWILAAIAVGAVLTVGLRLRRLHVRLRSAS